MKQIYHLPVRVEIESDNPDAAMLKVAEVIYNALAVFMNCSDFNEHVRVSDVEYSIFVKADKETFGKRKAKWAENVR